MTDLDRLDLWSVIVSYILCFNTVFTLKTEKMNSTLSCAILVFILVSNISAARLDATFRVSTTYYRITTFNPIERFQVDSMIACQVKVCYRGINVNSNS